VTRNLGDCSLKAKNLKEVRRSELTEPCACLSVCEGFRQQDAVSVNLAVDCAVDGGLCDYACEPGSPEAGTLDHCTCPTGLAIDSSGHKCLGKRNLTVNSTRMTLTFSLYSVYSLLKQL